MLVHLHEGMRPLKKLRALACALVLLGAPALALEVSGRVLDAKGKALPFVRIRVGGPGAVPFTTTVFSSADGSFSAHDGRQSADGLEIDVFRIGWKEINRKVTKTASGATVDVKMQRVSNVADQVPASAWLKGEPDSTAYQMTTLHCSNCHQLGSYRVRNFSAKLAGVPAGDRSESWLKRAADDLAAKNKGRPWQQQDASEEPAHGRVAAWESMVQFMRYKTLRLGEHDELRWGLKEGGPYYNALLQPATSLFSPRDMAIVVPNLAHNFPVKFDTYVGYNDIARLGQYGVTKNTVFTEYVLPTFGWTREIALAPGSRKVWFIETDKDRLAALDPQDGSVKWYPIPGKGRQGPHTMNADADGNIWIGLEESFSIARFNTKTEAWRIYPPPAGTDFGVTHDFAINSDRHVEADAEGRIFITDMGKNELWGINTDSGDIKKYRLPLLAEETHFHSLLYGAAIDAKRNRVWWAQLYGYVGSFDTQKSIAERLVPFNRGEGPRRLAVQEDGTLWVPLFGAGQLVKVDGDTGAELGRYTIPDRGSGPYGITLDKKRNAIWAATCNSDRIYRFDIATKKWRQYPMPRKETYIRAIEVDAETGDVWTTYSSLPVGRRDVKVFGTESANNIIIRLRPGD
jgi:streptogramin lyase